jgi:ferric-dicitrate binding protein FerR (iron transport regulator)
MAENMDHLLLSRILSGEANQEEKEAFYLRLGESKVDEELFYEIKSLWIRSSLNNRELDVDSSYNEFLHKINRKARPRKITLVSRVMKYAAILLLMLCIGGLTGYFYSERNTGNAYSGIQKFSALKGSVSIVELTDGTKIWLNSGSQLTYREDPKGKQRLAELTGEAFFEVTHNEKFPFLVKAGKLTVRDLGTAFNIKAYSTDRLVETSLVEGKAEILNSSGGLLSLLKPGDNAIYTTDNGKIEIKPIENNVLSAWRDGKFVIRDQRLEDIFRELSRWYDVEFRFENPKFKDYRYTGNIKKTTTAQHILKMLKLTTHFNYRIIEKPAEPDVIIIY